MCSESHTRKPEFFLVIELCLLSCSTCWFLGNPRRFRDGLSAPGCEHQGLYPFGANQPVNKLFPFTSKALKRWLIDTLRGRSWRVPEIKNTLQLLWNFYSPCHGVILCTLGLSWVHLVPSRFQKLTECSLSCLPLQKPMLESQVLMVYPTFWSLWATPEEEFSWATH